MTEAPPCRTDWQASFASVLARCISQPQRLPMRPSPNAWFEVTDERSPSLARASLLKIFAYFTLLALTVAPPAAVDSATAPMHVGKVSSNADRWQRIDFRSKPPLRNPSQIRIAIQTKGPSMQGLIRIPGGTASNFDTGKGMTVIDLTNLGSEANGYADVVALEVLFTRSMPDQSFQVFTVDNVDGMNE